MLKNSEKYFGLRFFFSEIDSSHGDLSFSEVRIANFDLMFSFLCWIHTWGQKCAFGRAPTVYRSYISAFIEVYSNKSQSYEYTTTYRKVPNTYVQYNPAYLNIKKHRGLFGKNLRYAGAFKICGGLPE